MFPAPQNYICSPVSFIFRLVFTVPSNERHYSPVPHNSWKGLIYTTYTSPSTLYVYPVSILYKSIAGRYRPVRVADGPITVRYRFIKNASRVPSVLVCWHSLCVIVWLCSMIVALPGHLIYSSLQHIKWFKHRVCVLPFLVCLSPLGMVCWLWCEIMALLMCEIMALPGYLLYYVYNIQLVPTHFDITKTCLYNFDPLIPHFYIVKQGLTGAYIIFFIYAQKHRLWVLVRTTSLCFKQKYEKYQSFLFYLKIFSFWRRFFFIFE